MIKTAILMPLSEYYKKVSLYPSIVVLIITIIFSVIDNYNYKSEWLTAGTVIWLSILVVFVYCLVLSLLSLTIFLNTYHKVKDNGILNFLSWFLLPVGLMTVVLVREIIFKIEFNERFDKDFLYLLIINLPFLFGLISSYLSYRRTNY